MMNVTATVPLDGDTPQGAPAPVPVVALDAKVALLKNPQTYVESPSPVRAIETHMSWVFLTDAHAYKLKKPVRYDFLDFSTLAAREWNCREELRLNQSLAPGVYLAVVPLIIDRSGTLRLEGEGVVVDWLVKMRRLPAERMLDVLIRAHQLSEPDVQSLAQVLTTFYRECRPVPMSGLAYRAQFERMIALNREVLASPRYDLPPLAIAHTHNALARLLRTTPEMLDRRVAEGRVIEGHGDLRPEHICLETRPIVFDRLEFNREFRLVDPVDELCFLSMECERLGEPTVGRVLIDTYKEALRDEPPSSLTWFYRAHRACVRARLAALHTAELPRSAWARWLQMASEYLRMAQGYAEHLEAHL